jgi:hypothetical protein
MHPSRSRDLFFNHKFVLCAALLAFLSSTAASGQAQPAVPVTPTAEGGRPTLEDLHGHAETIAEILDTASARVESLAASGAQAPDLLGAIRQELMLSRRWNRHLTSILQDVAEARRALGERERDAAREILRMTAAAEEAQRELIALKKVLTGEPAATAEGGEGWSDSRSYGEVPDDLGGRVAANVTIVEPPMRSDAGLPSDLVEARLALLSMEQAQSAVIRNVDTVRGKIIEALQTLAAVQGDSTLDLPRTGGELSSEGITAWAASIATKGGARPAGQGGS